MLLTTTCWCPHNSSTTMPKRAPSPASVMMTTRSSVRRSRRADIQEIAELHERHQIAAQPQHARRADQSVDVGGRRPQAFHDRRHRHDVGLRTDPDDHAVHHRERQRQRQLNSHAAAAIRLERNAPADVLDIAANDVHADAAAGNVGDLFGGREAGQEDEIVDLIVAERSVGAHQSALARLVENALGIDTGAVVPDLDDDAAAAMLRGKPDRSFLGFSRGRPIRRRFDAVIDRVADDVGQRIAETFDDRSIDLGVFAQPFRAAPSWTSSSASSRTSRGMRWNTAFTCCARIDITLSLSSRVW